MDSKDNTIVLTADTKEFREVEYLLLELHTTKLVAELQYDNLNWVRRN